jgi:hypothetical protein
LLARRNTADRKSRFRLRVDGRAVRLTPYPRLALKRRATAMLHRVIRRPASTALGVTRARTGAHPRHTTLNHITRKEGDVQFDDPRRPRVRSASRWVNAHDELGNSNGHIE